MARTNIEEESFSRISKLREIMGCSEREALGTVAFLWHDSQDILKTHGTKADIKDWCRLYQISDEEVEKWISALEKARFISCEESGLFSIHGNEIQIDGRVKRIHKAAKGAKATKKKWQARKKKQEGLKQAPSTLQADSERANPMQTNAMQISAVVVENSAAEVGKVGEENKNPSELFEARFDPINQALLKLLEPFKLASNYQRHVIALRQRFDTAEELAEFIDHVINAKALEKETDPTKPKTVRYLAGALNKELGLSSKKEAQP